LLDAEILADVYLRMTGGQTALALDGQGDAMQSSGSGELEIRPVRADRPALVVLRATSAEREAHRDRLARIGKGGSCLWPEETGGGASGAII
jgi:DNA polymerase-3 subunit epsilon